ncbi:hypothetical protein BGW36DRAFT_387205 [Talaromyces proteolyticus]|uniref:Uncharacterized protein n=1 Tax=Talaromyces proteolyticus TaxID=1131652 RepID=A0AAD4KN40_9EURO|nr:uncharacterized protein BGW36DRAFT_387205 [Talaromyces proteolyticus]KAH8692222.1 hypothetical protein BGW36DRAFT_387205 [Talaromyces proteolyticus]
MSDPFIITTGPPSIGKGLRLSKVRSHVARKFHQQHKQQTDHYQQIAKRISNSNIQRKNHQHVEFPVDPMIPVRHNTTSGNEYHGLVTSVGERVVESNHHDAPESTAMVQELALLRIDPTRVFISQKVCERMQQFVYQHLTVSHHNHPFFRVVIPASVLHVPMMSVKVLNATLYDDLQQTRSGESVSTVTLWQRQISMRLLTESLHREEEALSDANIASLISFLSFEMVTDNAEAYHLHKKGIQVMIERRGGIDELGFEGHLKNGILITRELQKILPGFVDTTRCPSIFDDPAPHNQRIQRIHDMRWINAPVDLRMFTFDCIPADQSHIAVLGTDMCRLLTSFYELVTLPIRATRLQDDENGTTREEQRKRYEKQWLSLYTTILFFSPSSSPASNFDTFTTPIINVIRHTALLFTLSPSSATTDTSSLLDQFERLLNQSELQSLWGPLPGALIWCLVIAARASPSRSRIRMWLMMQITRTVWPLALDLADEVLGSTRVVVLGLDELIASTFDRLLQSSHNNHLPFH